VARALGASRVAIVCADDDVALTAAWDALSSGIATPLLIGNGKKIEARVRALGLEGLLAADRIIDVADSAQAALTACRMAASGEADILLKGHLRTDELLRALLDRANGLRTGRLLSDVLLYEDVLSGAPRLVAITDGGLNVLPTLDQKRQIVLNAIDVLHAIGIARPRVALMSATEVVTESIPSTVDALESSARRCCSGRWRWTMLWFSARPRQRASRIRLLEEPTAWWCQTLKLGICWGKQ
jgi:phosphotransacetylase